MSTGTMPSSLARTLAGSAGAATPVAETAVLAPVAGTSTVTGSPVVPHPTAASSAKPADRAVRRGSEPRG
nr:hypothetical protein GCM10020241_50390 [Streptoalloteichus tenebrarius]